MKKDLVHGRYQVLNGDYGKLVKALWFRPQTRASQTSVSTEDIERIWTSISNAVCWRAFSVSLVVSRLRAHTHTLNFEEFRRAWKRIGQRAHFTNIIRFLWGEKCSALIKARCYSPFSWTKTNGRRQRTRFWTWSVGAKKKPTLI